MECEEVQICDICGDAGYDDELAICDRCNDSAEHIYCMAAMRDSVPRHWVCERCEVEEKGSAKKRFACSEPLPINAIQKHINATDPPICSEMNDAKNVVRMPKALSQSRAHVPLNCVSQRNEPALISSPSSPSLADKEGKSGVHTQAHNIPNLKERSPMSPKDMPAVKTCLSTPRPEKEAVKAAGLSSPTLKDMSCLDKSATVSKVRDLNVTQKDAVCLSKSLAGRPLSGSKRVFSRSLSLDTHDDQPTFLLPSRPKDLKRSKSAVVRPTVNWTSRSSIKSSYRDDNSSFVIKEWHNDSNHATHECAIRGASCWTKSSKSTSAEPKTHRQAGEHKNKQYDWTPRDSESLQFYGVSSDCGKETSFQHLKKTRRCYSCHEVGHIAAKCKYSSSSSLEVREAKKARASFDKTMAAQNPIPETDFSLHAEKEINSPKKSALWKSQDSSTSPKSASMQTQVCKKEGLVMVDSMNLSCQLSAKPSESHETQMTEQVLSPKGRVGTHCSVEGNATLQQAEGVNAVKDEYSQELGNPVFISNPYNWGSGEIVSKETGLALCEIVAEPCVDILWSGCFNVFSKCLKAYNGMQAHASSKADPRVSEAMKSLPLELHLEELKRGVETDTWPRSLQERPPTSSSIGVYFFPVDMDCHDTWYKPLLDHLAANDLALTTSLNYFQLLIFPSLLLPEADQCWEDRQYLWGILRSATLKSSHTATLGETGLH